MSVWTLLLLLVVLGYGPPVNGLDDDNVICPSEWDKVHRGCYLFVSDRKNWDHAFAFCRDKQGTLVVVQSAMERNALAAHLKNKKIGSRGDWYAGFRKQNGQWKTVEDENLMTKVVSWKHPKMATRRSFDCGVLKYENSGSTLHLASLRCRQRKPFICEYHAITARPSTESTTLQVTEEQITFVSQKKESPSPATVAATIPTDSEDLGTSGKVTKYPPAISTTLSDSDVPSVLQVTQHGSKQDVDKPSPSIASSQTTEKPKPTEGLTDPPETAHTVRMSRSTNGFGISLETTENPDSGDTDEGDASDTTNEQGGTDEEVPTGTEAPITYLPIDEIDFSKSEDGDSGHEEEVTSSDSDSNNGRYSTSLAVGKGRKRTSTTPKAQTTVTTVRMRKPKPTPPKPRPTRYDWEEALEEFEGCYIPGGRRSARAQVMTARAFYQQRNSRCPAVRAARIDFPMSETGVTVKAPCRRGYGFATFTCGGDPVCWEGQPDVTGCASPKFKALLEKVDIDDDKSDETGEVEGTVDPIEVEPPSPEESVNVTAELVEVTETEDVSMEDIIVTSKVITAVTRKSKKAKFKRNKKQIAEIVDNVVKAGSNLMSKKKRKVWKKMSRGDKVRSATSLMVAMETATVSMAEEIEEPTVIKQSYENVEMEIQVVDIEALEREEKEELVYDSSESDSTFSIPMETLKDVSKGGLAKAVFMTHYSMADLLSSTSKSSDDTSQKDSPPNSEIPEHVNLATDTQAEGDTQPEGEEQETEDDGLKLASYILSASLGVDAPLTKLLEPISFFMKHTVKVQSNYEVLCSFWNVSRGNGIGFWSQDGCRVKKTNTSHTTCECDHMTNFAILLDVHDLEISKVHESALRLVTIIGCVISCVSLTAAWFTFQCFTSLQGERTSIHKNLAVCLLLAEILFVAGVDQAKHQLACSVIAVFLHFFFLAAFTWMFLEGFHIIIMLVQVFDASRSRLPYYYLVGYGLPTVIVGVSCIVNFHGYGTDRFCWLTTESYFIWAFAGPVALILMVNAIFLTYALTTVCRHADYVFNPKDKTTGSGIRQWILGALALEVLLGLTWMFGYFLLSDAGLTMAYIFTILNSLQGLFIFVFHCLLNKKAQKEYCRIMRVPLSRSSSSAGTQSTLTKRNNAHSRSHEMNHSNSHKQSFNRGTYNPTTTSTTSGSSTSKADTSNGDVIV